MPLSRSADRRRSAIGVGLSAGGLLLLLSACGVKGPPRPPLPRDPQPVRGLTLRQAGASIEMTWSRPQRRENGSPIDGLLTYRVLARALDRPKAPSGAGASPAPSGPGAPAGKRATPPGLAGPASGGAGIPGAWTGSPPSGAFPPSAPGAPAGSGTTATPAPGGLAGRGGLSGEAARAQETDFLKGASVVAEVREPVPSGAPGAAPGPKGPGPRRVPDPGEPSAGTRALPDFTIDLGPERFPGAHITAARLALAVVAVDGQGRSSRPRPILQIDPVAALPPPAALAASGEPEGVRLSWRLPEGAAPAAVNLYRVNAPDEEKAPPSFPATPIPGSPFPGESAVDRSAGLGASYFYEARVVATGPGVGVRESPPAGPVRIDYLDRFPPGPPSLVTVDSIPEDAVRLSFSVRVAWSSPIDRDLGGFRIYRAKGEGPFSLVAEVGASQNEWADTHLGEGTYHYYVTAIDTARPPNESERSETVDAALG